MTNPPNRSVPDTPGSGLRVMLAWLYVGIPLAWGVWLTLIKSLALFS